MTRPIRNLRELNAEKARLSARIRTAEEELLASVARTRAALESYVEQKMEIPRQIGQMFQEEAQQSTATTILRGLIQAAGVSRRWSNILVALAPIVATYARRKWQQFRLRRQKIAAPTEASCTTDPGAVTSPR